MKAGSLCAGSAPSSPTSPSLMWGTTLSPNIIQTHFHTIVNIANQSLELIILSTCMREIVIENPLTLVWSIKIHLIIQQHALLNSNTNFLPGILSTPEDLKRYIVQDELKGPTCGICFSFSHRSKSNVQNHIESKHFPNSFTYSCPKCFKNVSTKKALEIHNNRCKVPLHN